MFPSPYGDYLLSEMESEMAPAGIETPGFRPLTGIIFSLSRENRQSPKREILVSVPLRGLSSL